MVSINDRFIDILASTQNVILASAQNVFGFASNNSTDQPLHPRSLISAFVISVLENTISKLAKNELTLFYLVYVAE